ncbi:hypothetical protein CPB83DRAFT_630282 [Crepidotus variabilis]|uniref:F-box domain-containing protein n=1 Tax=Crepidotus variabilis TaxID=179855 RepID=A0A9P6EP02_9AGAR|nr:hypothetical protein CPB83DRAFT_630282 [Crepidotus variabilis]
MPLSIVDVPHDILLLICVKLSPENVLSFAQTCRGVHAIADSEYVWRHLNYCIPLDISAVNGHDIKNVPGSTIKSSVLDALRLDKNWRREDSKIARIRKIDIGHSVLQMIPLGHQWLATMAKTDRTRDLRPLYQISVWRLRDAHGSRHLQVATFDTVLSCQFAASLQDSGNTILLAFGNARTDIHLGSCLEVYELDVRPCSNDNFLSFSPSIIRQWHIYWRSTIYRVFISGTIVSALFLNLDSFTVATPFLMHHAVILNSKTNATEVMELGHTGFAIHKLDIQWPCLVTTGLHNTHSIVVRVLPPGIRATTIQSHQKIISLEKIRPFTFQSSDLVFDCQMGLPGDHQRMSEGDKQGSPRSLTEVYVTTSPHPELPGKATVFRLPLDVYERNIMLTNVAPQYTFNIPAHSTWAAACIGRTGYRAIWLEKTTFGAADGSIQLMKGTFPYSTSSEEQSLVVRLARVDYPYPFEFGAIRDLELQEAAGRVFISLYTGHIYAFEF